MKKITQFALTLTGCAVLAACSTTPAKVDNSSRAQQLAQQFIIVDTHIDVPYRLHKDWEDVTVATKRGEFDYPRARQGGLNAPFMSIYIPASYERTGGGYQLANQLIDNMEALVGRAPDKFAMAYTTADVEQQFGSAKISLALGMENGTPIEGKLENLKHFYDRGIRYITLAHSESNHISDSSYDLRRRWNGLSPFGKELVEAMNNIGMMIDISHVSDAAFYQTVELSKVPVIASHSSLRSYTPGFERNMDDDMIRALAKMVAWYKLTSARLLLHKWPTSMVPCAKLRLNKPVCQTMTPLKLNFVKSTLTPSPRWRQFLIILTTS